mmetsp:Transcript_56554/g.164047  ORF Transcript_56554/g.164047 Transcript_56554/m.164047 type:complete len:273 (-) Transcript_56554:1614-2432(-)
MQEHLRSAHPGCLRRHPLLHRSFDDAGTSIDCAAGPRARSGSIGGCNSNSNATTMSAEEKRVPRCEGPERSPVREAVAPDACGLQKTAVPALPQHRGVVEVEGGLHVVGPQTTDVVALTRLQCGRQSMQLLLEHRDQCPPKEAARLSDRCCSRLRSRGSLAAAAATGADPAAPTSAVAATGMAVNGGGGRPSAVLGGREDLGHEGAGMAAKEGDDIRPVRTRVLAHELGSLVVHLASEVPDPKYAPRITWGTAECGMRSACRRNRIRETSCA